MRSLLFITWVVLLAVEPRTAVGQVLPPQISLEPEEVTDAEFHVSVDDEMAAQIKAHVGRLGSPLYQERETAVRKLISLGAASFATLRHVYSQSDALEVRLRIEDVVHEAYLNRHVFDRNGFLGIQQLRVPHTNDDDERILEGYYGVAIGKIIPDTAAQDFDLRKGDVIIELDGEPLKRGAGNMNQSFGESLRTRGPGTLVVLTILRGEEKFEIEIPLGRRPKHLYQRQAVVSEQLANVERNFGIWWVKFFRNTPKTPPGD